MGVTHLWSILEPVKKKENISALSNKTLCVDLSGWICEAQGAKGLQENVPKPHLRNIFFRVLHLTRLGVKLIFVTDGNPPELKWDTIVKRSPPKNKEWTPGSPVGRSQFEFCVKECRSLLNLLGVPCIESAEEAEALCAWLELNKKVDGCITNDGDAFLYGARNVYRDLSISRKDASVECYNMEEIETRLKLNRKNMIALGILLGCDYHSKGVPGVGYKKAMKLLDTLNEDNLIDRFYKWTKGTELDEELSSVERSIKSKALKDKDFPHPEVIEEYLNPKVAEEEVLFAFTHPDLPGLQEFCSTNLNWNEDYTREKAVLLISFWQMTSLLQDGTSSKILVQPERIVKTRVQQKIECYEVEWQNIDLGETCPVSFVTIETRELFAKAYPELVKEFNEGEAAKLSQKKSKTKSKIKKSQEDEHEEDTVRPNIFTAGSDKAKRIPKSRKRLFEKSRKEEGEGVIKIPDSDNSDASSDENIFTKKTKLKNKKSKTEEQEDLVIEISDSDDSHPCIDENAKRKRVKSKTKNNKNEDYGKEHDVDVRCSRLRKMQKKKETTPSPGRQRSITDWTR